MGETPKRISANTEPWHLDRKVPIALILTIMIQSATIVWWASEIQERVNHGALVNVEQNTRLTKLEDAKQTACERLAKVEQLAESIYQAMNHLADKIDRAPPARSP